MAGADRKLQQFDVSAIEVHGRLRAIKEAGVEAVAASLASIGLRTPISVRYFEERPEGMPPGETADAVVLLTGAHRLEAAKRLGWDKIECFVYFDGDEVDAQLWEIAENLHRSELTALERDEQVALWVKLNAERVSLQSATKPQGGRPESGVRAAARELGIESTDAHRAVKVAGLSEEAKEAAREAGLDDNRSALLEAAKHSVPEEQVKAIKEKKAKKEALAATAEPEPEFDPLAVRAVTRQPDYNGLPPDLRILELMDHVSELETDIRGYVAELRTFRDMKVQFEQGGFDKVVAGKDEEIRVLKEQVYSESADKIAAVNEVAALKRKRDYWMGEAKRLGWAPPTDKKAAPSDYEDAFLAAVNGAEG